MKQSDVTTVIAESARYAGVATKNRPHVDVNKVVRIARERLLHGSNTGRRFVMAATAAAVLVVAVASVVMVGRQPLHETPIPDSLVFLVDSLYPEVDYMVDEVSPYFADLSSPDSVLGDRRPTETGDFLDAVWGQVLEQTTD